MTTPSATKAALANATHRSVLLVIARLGRGRASIEIDQRSRTNARATTYIDKPIEAQ
jgi:hypothetical protein